MTAFEYLSQFGYNDRKIKLILMELEELRSKAISITSAGNGEKVSYTKSTEASFEKVLELIWEREQKIAEELNRLEQKQTEIKETIETVANADERAVLLCRYCYYKTFYEIAIELGYCEKTIRNIHKRAMNHVLVPNIK